MSRAYAYPELTLSWTQAVATFTQGAVVSLDGKTVRASLDRATAQSPIHGVSAWWSHQTSPTHPLHMCGINRSYSVKVNPTRADILKSSHQSDLGSFAWSSRDPLAGRR